MKPGDGHDPPRWKTASHGARPAERWLKDALREMDGAPDVDALALARAWRRMAAVEARRFRRPLRRWAAVVCAFVLGSAAVSLASWLSSGRHRGVAPAALPAAPAGATATSSQWRIRTQAAVELHVAVREGGRSLLLTSGEAEVTPLESPQAPASRPADTAPAGLSPGTSVVALPAPPSRAAARRRSPRRLAAAREADPRPATAEWPRAGEGRSGGPSEGNDPLPAPQERPVPVPVAAAPPPLTAPAPPSERPQAPLSPPAFPAPVTISPPSIELAALPSEAQLLAEAMRQLRDTGDVAKTLAQLNTYDDLYRQGRLAPEARLLRAQVLLRANRQTEALSVLDPLLLGGDAVTRPTTALRGDLRAAHGRCADAAVDFTLVIGPDRTDALAERALYARAVCRSQLGDVDGARADARTYLRLFPRGTHGGEVQRFISSTPGGP